MLFQSGEGLGELLDVLLILFCLGKNDVQHKSGESCAGDAGEQGQNSGGEEGEVISSVSAADADEMCIRDSFGVMAWAA